MTTGKEFFHQKNSKRVGQKLIWKQEINKKLNVVISKQYKISSADSYAPSKIHTRHIDKRATQFGSQNDLSMKGFGGT